MKLFALLAVLPAILALPKPEPYHPFLAAPLSSNSTLSGNPISHGALNSRASIVAKAPRADAGHLSVRSVKHDRRALRKVKRQSTGTASCIPRDTTAVPSSSATGTTTGGSVTEPSPSPSSTTTTGAQTQPSPSPSSSATTTTGAQTQPSPSPSPSPSATTTTTQSPPQQTNFNADPDGNGPFKGQATYYDTDVGYGSCGVWHKNSDATIALSAELMNIWPGQTSNPNLSPVCGQRMQINYGGKSLIAEVQDTCPSCTKRWIDMSQGVFEYFADTDVGMLGVDGYTPGLTWQWVDPDTPLTVLPH